MALRSRRTPAKTPSKAPRSAPPKLARTGPAIGSHPGLRLALGLLYATTVGASWPLAAADLIPAAALQCLPSTHAAAAAPPLNRCPSTQFHPPPLPHSSWPPPTSSSPCRRRCRRARRTPCSPRGARCRLTGTWPTRLATGRCAAALLAAAPLLRQGGGLTLSSLTTPESLTLASPSARPRLPRRSAHRGRTRRAGTCTRRRAASRPSPPASAPTFGSRPRGSRPPAASP